MVVAAAAAFWPVLGNEFVNWDDPDVLLRNAQLASPGVVRWAFTTDLIGHYQPLSWLTFAIDWSIGGLRPITFHLTNLLLHVANGLLVYVLALRILERGGGPERPLRAVAAAAALFFALHPLRVEAVAWATERRDVLATFFVLLTTLAYVRWCGKGGARWWGVALGLYALSLLAGAWGITLPVVLLALDVGIFRRLEDQRTTWRALLIEKVPFVILAAAAALLAARAQRESEAMLQVAEHGVFDRLAQAAYGLAHYVWKTVLPLRLSPLYELPEPMDPFTARFVVSAVVVAGITIALCVGRRRWPAGLLAWSCYVILVSPVLGFAQSGPQLVADRYTYLPCIPFALLLGGMLSRLFGSGRRRALASGAAIVVGLGSLGVLTFRQSLVWRDTLSLWNQAIAVDPESGFAFYNRATARRDAGDEDGATADFREALRLWPSMPYHGQAIARAAVGDLAGSIADFVEAIRLDPADPVLRYFCGLVRQATGDAAGAQRDFLDALEVAPPDWPLRSEVERLLRTDGGASGD